MLINFRRVSEFEEIPVGNYQEYESMIHIRNVCFCLRFLTHSSMWLYQEVTEKYITEIYRKNIILKYKEKEGEGSDLGRFLFLLHVFKLNADSILTLFDACIFNYEE